MELETALKILDEALVKLLVVRSGQPFSAEHVEFVQSTGLELARIFGSDSPISKNFNSITYRSNETILTSHFTYRQDIANQKLAGFHRGLDAAEGILRSARSQLERHGVDRILSESRIKSEGARVFISHGVETPALAKIERFLRALGLNPIVVMREPSEGMSVDALVEKRLGESDCAIILATGDDSVGEYRQPRPNVIHEIGLAQERLGNKVIYLKEVGCEFPSNVRPKVWENFTQENMEKSFEKIIKEIRAFGLL